MKSTHVTALSLAMLIAGTAFAQSPPRDRHTPGTPEPYSQGRNDEERNRGPEMGNDRQNDNRPDSHPQARSNWSRGDQLPQKYRQRGYVVDDWRHRNLQAPPRGQHWVRNDNNEFVLAIITSGIIVSILNQDDYRDTHRWARGEQLSYSYRDDAYRINDWRRYNLRRPARGQYWVSVGDQFVLYSSRSGAIIMVLDRRRN
jgi:Ni/Co efflux regulator RcnB